MREDMFKVIVERPRGGRGSASARRKRREEDVPAKIGMLRHALITRRRNKWLNENLAPLKRFFRSRLGRRWDDIYSEVAATLAPGHTVKEHVRQHIDDIVARKVVIARDGSWSDLQDWKIGYRDKRPWRQRFYVDPRDGVLKDSETLWKSLGIDTRPWKWRPEKDPTIHRIDKMRELRCIDGIWYEVLYRHDPLAPGWAYDLVERITVPASRRHAVAKRQLSGAELKCRGLANEIKE